MKFLVALVALLALCGSAMAWDLSDKLTYSEVKSGFQEAGTSFILPQITGTTSGVYVKEPGPAGTPAALTPGDYGQAWGQVDNTLTSVAVNRAAVNPAEDASNANFYETLTQGGSADIYEHSADSSALSTTNTPEIVGDATAYQNLNVLGQFSKLDSSFDSRAIVGMSNIPADNTNTIENSKHFVVTDLGTNAESVDALTHGSGLFNTANTGASVTADISQDWVGSGWNAPTYSGGIDEWANFAGACDPHCSNPIMTTVSGTAYTGLFPANGPELFTDSNGLYGQGNVGDVAYWGSAFATNPQETTAYGGNPFNTQW
jgi:hypothetical protein